MATKTLTISVPVEMALFLKHNSELSPSKMFQAKVLDVQNTQRQAGKRLKIVEIQRDTAMKFINHRELWEEFLKWRLEQ